MHIISRRTLIEFWQKHPDAEEPLKAWFVYVKSAKWKNTAEIRSMFSHADFLENGRVCFNIGGNKYRLIVKVVYKLKRVYIRFIGTHAKYDRVDANKV